MPDYKTFVAYLKVKAKITPGKIFPRMYFMFENHEDLAKKVFNELAAGTLNKNSDAGTELFERCRRYVENNGTTYTFIQKLQQSFPHITEELTDIFKKRPALHDVAFPCVTEDCTKST